MMPLAVAVVAPQRARVARSLDSFAALARLDSQQRAELDGAAHQAATAIQERVMDAVVNGEFDPATFKPMAGVDMAHDLLEIVERGNRRFVGSLREDQRAQLAQHPFDFGDYLVFSTPWEAALELLE
jgi:cation diffusion facilitator CzcD-associated flavoprotein CzcO